MFKNKVWYVLIYRTEFSHFSCNLTIGHSSPAMILMHYQYVMDGQKRTAVEALPELAHVPKSMCPKEKALAERQ